jgi:hypothetical protein
VIPAKVLPYRRGANSQLTAHVVVQLASSHPSQGRSALADGIQNGKIADRAVRAGRERDGGASGWPDDYGSAVRSATTSITNWLRHTLGINEPSRALLDFDALTPDAFVTAA